MHIEKLTSAIINDVVSGLKGYHQNLALSKRQVEEEVVSLRLALIKKYILEGILDINDVLIALDCINVDCESLDRCKCDSLCGEKIAHFQLPQIIWDLGDLAINYIGSTDRMYQFTVVTSLIELNTRKYRKRGKDKPYVWIDTTPNSNGLLDCFIFNAPLIQKVSVIAAFKDPRQVDYIENCCTKEFDSPVIINDVEKNSKQSDILSFIDIEIKNTLVEEKLKYYRQFAPVNVEPNNQEFNTGN